MKLHEIESLTMQDIILAKTLGISEEEILATDLFQQKRQLENLYDEHKLNKTNLKIETAQALEGKYYDICFELEDNYGKDFSGDAWYFHSYSFFDFVSEQERNKVFIEKINI